MMLSKKTILVLAIVLFGAAQINAQGDPVKAPVSVVRAVHVTGTWMQVENVSMGQQVKDDLFNGIEKFAQGASSVTEITLDPNTMSMLGDRRGPDADLARKLNFMVVRSYSYPKPGMYNAGDVEAFRKKLENGNWSCPIHVNNERGSNDICIRTGADRETNEMVILSVNLLKLEFIHIAGKMSLGELNEMTGRAGGLMPHVFEVPHPVPYPNPLIDAERKSRERERERDLSKKPTSPESPQAPQPPQPAQPPQ